MLIVALVVVEDVSLVRGALDSFRKKLVHSPYGATDKQALSKRGLHWNDLAPDDKTKVTECIHDLPFRCFVAFKSLGSQDKETYSADYMQLLVKLVHGRLVRYDQCVIDLVIEENSKIDEEAVTAAVASTYRRLEEAGSRRPSVVPRARQLKKGQDAALPLPDIVLGILGDYARLELKAAEEAKHFKKRVSGEQTSGSSKVRDKVRVIFDLDSGRAFSRRHAFRPWEPPAPSDPKSAPTPF